MLIPPTENAVSKITTTTAAMLMDAMFTPNMNAAAASDIATLMNPAIIPNIDMPKNIEKSPDGVIASEFMVPICF
jgi:hypothetical protein